MTNLEVFLNDVVRQSALLVDETLLLVTLAEKEQQLGIVLLQLVTLTPGAADGLPLVEMVDLGGHQDKEVNLRPVARLGLVPEVPVLVRTHLRPLVFGPERRLGPFRHE